MASNRQEKLEGLQNQILEGVRDLTADTENWKGFLDYLHKMSGYNYSFRNQLLLLWQDPEATMVRTFRQWQSDFNRYVKKGEKAIYLLRPMTIRVDEHGNRDPEGTEHKLIGFTSFPVFDIRQTDGEPLPESPYSVPISQRIPLESITNALEQYIQDKGYTFVNKSTEHPLSEGWTNFSSNTVWIRPELHQAQRINILAHEIAHIELHHPSLNRDLPRPVKEVEAESCAYLVCKELGIDVGDASFSYIGNWANGQTNNVEAVFKTLDNVKTAATTVLDIVQPLIAEQDENENTPENIKKSSIEPIEKSLTKSNQSKAKAIEASVQKQPSPKPNLRARPSIDRSLVEEAKRKDPTAMLEQAGYTVKWEGYNADVREQGVQVARITRKPDGTYLVNSDQGDPKGDNIDLAKWVRGNNDFAEAVQSLIGANPIVESPKRSRGVATNAAPDHWEPVRLPSSTPQHRYWGRKYLTEQRGISQATIEHAEQAGMLRYSNGGVLFVGLTSQGDIGSAFRRGYLNTDPTPKRDLRGSQKQYAPILPGQDPSRVWIVEGGMDALALHDLYAKKDRPTPTVIIAGGAGSTAYTKPSHIRQIIENASSITVAGDNDLKADTRERTAQHREHAVEQLRSINPSATIEEWIPKGVNDLADLNKYSSPGGKASSPKALDHHQDFQRQLHRSQLANRQYANSIQR